MVIEVDIKKLVENLKNEKGAEPAKLSEGTKYLMDTVFSVLVADKPLRVGDIDFKKFTQQECWDFSHHVLNTLGEKSNKVEGIHNFFHRCKPKITARRAFF